MHRRRYILKLSCPDRVGIVAAVSGFLAQHKGWIVESQNHADPDSQRFFMRQEILADSLGFSAEELLRRPEIDYEALCELCPELGDASPVVRQQAEIQVKYDGYLKKQQAQVERAQAMEAWRLPADMDYHSILSLRLEARQKLADRQPRSLNQAGRIQGVNPADIAVLMVWLKKNRLGGDRL